ncbi:MAG: HAD hydrolase-like protein [Candidatus Babeliaceae bacterium]|nr:HAD hydrolase-like protein [Candidatus Babeliaceae bacterium]
MSYKILLCDLGGTFVDVNKRTYAIQELGIDTIILNGLTNYLNFNPQQKMFAALQKIDHGDSKESITHGTAKLPKIYCDWMAGKHSNPTAARAFILEQIDELYHQHFFATSFEYKVIRNAIQAMFTPEKLIKHQYAIEPMMQLLERIDLQENTIVIVSNWDQHSYKLFLESKIGKRFCKLVKKEHMIVSGYIGFNKPQPEFYNQVFQKFGTPEQTEYFFIDNEPVNIEAAQRYNIPSLLYTGDHRAIEKAFINRKILKN